MSDSATARFPLNGDGIMSRIATIDLELKKNSKIRTILLFLTVTDDPDPRLRKIVTNKDGKGQFEVTSPGTYKIIWYVTGDPGGAITLVASEAGNVISQLKKEVSVIDAEQKDNSGWLRVRLGEMAAGENA